MAEISRLSVELHKATGDYIWSSFSKAHDEALALYDGRKLNECIHKCLEILGAQSEALLYRQVANHFRISTLMLLCVVVRDNVSFFAGRPDLYLVTHGIDRLLRKRFSCDHDDKETIEAIEKLDKLLDELHHLVETAKQRAEARHRAKVERDDSTDLSKSKDEGPVIEQSTPGELASATMASSKPMPLAEDKPVSLPQTKKDELMSLSDEKRGGIPVMPSPEKKESTPYNLPYRHRRLRGKGKGKLQ